MQIDIQTRPFVLTNAMRNHTERRVNFAMGTRENHIRRVTVRLSDVNGSHGREDKCCHIHVMLTHLPEVVVEDTRADIYTAINRAIDRAGRTVGRRLAHMHENNHLGSPGDARLITETNEPIQ